MLSSMVYAQTELRNVKITSQILGGGPNMIKLAHRCPLKFNRVLLVGGHGTVRCGGRNGRGGGGIIHEGDKEAEQILGPMARKEK